MTTAPNKIITIDNEQYELVPLYLGFDEKGERILHGYILRPLKSKSLRE